MHGESKRNRWLKLNRITDAFEEFDVASCLLQKEEEEELIEHFLELQIDENKAAAPVHDQDVLFAIFLKTCI